MKLQRLLAAGGAVGCTVLGGVGTARADVTWEHTVTVSMSKLKNPMMKMKMYSSFAPQRQRMLIKYDLNGMNQLNELGGGRPKGGDPFSGMSPFGSLALIQRLDDDHLVGYASQAKAYIDEPRKSLFERLRFDPWKKLSPELSNVPPPEFTLEQRKRLGAEVRAATKPLLDLVMRAYFRELPEKRTIDGMETKGYRLTYLFNAGGLSPSGQQWIRYTIELWMAGDQPGDEVIRDLQKTLREDSKDPKRRSTSMWLNEFFPVLWYTMPEALQQMVDTLAPPEGSERYGFGGTPVRILYTITMPPMQRQMIGDVHEEVALTKRSTETLAPAVFEAPAGYEKTELDPWLKKWEKLMQGDFSDLPIPPIPGMAPGSMGAPGMNLLAEDLGFSLQAWNQYQRAVCRVLPPGL